MEPDAVKDPNAVERLVAAEEPDEKPGQESVACGLPVAGQEPATVEKPTAVQDDNKAGKKEEDADAESDEGHHLE